MSRKKVIALRTYEQDCKEEEESEGYWHGTERSINDDESDQICCVEEKPFVITRQFPFFIALINTMNWLIYFYGIIFLIGFENTNFSSTTPLSPPDDSWFFFTVTWYPECSDARGDSWRVISLQFVHEGMMHIFGNTVASIGFGAAFEVYQPYGYATTFIIYQCAVIFGTMGHSLLWPFRGLIGCSPGVYGLIGACWSQVVTNREAYDPISIFLLTCAVSVQMALDILLYLTSYSTSTGYASHFFGLLTGLSLGLAYSGCIKKQGWVKVLGVFGLIGFILLVCFLTSHFLRVWPPEPFVRSYFHNYPVSEEGCCAQMYQYMEENEMSLSDAQAGTYCHNKNLYPK